MLIEIALPLPLLKTFHYSCPSGPGGMLEPGQRILVPFQNRQLTGYFLRRLPTFPEEEIDPAKIKEILAPLDSTSLVSGELFLFSRWMADYYFAPLGEILKACHPPKTNLESFHQVSLTPAGMEMATGTKLAEVLGEEEGQVLLYLLEQQSVELQSLGKKIRESESGPIIKKLLRRGWIKVDQILPGPRSTEKTKWVVSLSPEYDPLSAIPRLTRLQSRVIEYLTTAPSPVFLSRIQEELAISPAVLRGLEKKGTLSFTRESIRRDPFQSLPEFSVAPRPVLTEEQKAALAELWDAAGRNSFSPALLHGVTGSGKTEVYLALIERMLEAKKRSLLLMPEIGLTPRVAWEFRERLGDQVAILHSGLADGERHDEWWRIKRGEVGVVIGTRSAVFAPLDHLKLIVVDEEHDPSYKQQETPRYQGRDCALMRGKLNEALVVLGSATPSIESCYNARNGKYRYVRLNSRVQDRPLPKVHLVDMREDFRLSEKKSVLSSELGKAIANRLERQEQVLVLLNRRGYSASVLCRSCGQTLPCRYCSIPLSYHKKRGQLLCHYCDYRISLPKACPQCGSEYLYLVGEGTEKVEVLLEKDHPTARIERLDRDVAQRKNARGDILSRFQKREIDILVGTQMIAKGHDFPQVTLAGILSADISLSFPDFRCAERTFQLLTQMAGRPGRGELVGEVLIQTFFPDHYCLKFVQHHDYDGFYEKELRFRRMMHYPPFSSLAMIQVTSKNLEEAGGIIQQLGKWLEGKAGKDFRILGPSPAPLARLKAEHRFQIILKASSRAKLHNLVRTCLEHAGAQGLDLRKIHIDIDPVNLL